MYFSSHYPHFFLYYTDGYEFLFRILDAKDAIQNAFGNHRVMARLLDSYFPNPIPSGIYGRSEHKKQTTPDKVELDITNDFWQEGANLVFALSKNVKMRIAVMDWIYLQGTTVCGNLLE